MKSFASSKDALQELELSLTAAMNSHAGRNRSTENQQV
jgi:hypothetical protein